MDSCLSLCALVFVQFRINTLRTQRLIAGPSGELRKYLAKLADADNVQLFVEQHPFGHPAITEGNDPLGLYREIVAPPVQ